jgi:hypothetical protein
MKVEEVVPGGFEPIELRLTIETKEEFLQLWHRMNLTTHTLVQLSEVECASLPSPENCSGPGCGVPKFWHVLNNIALKRGYGGKE